MHSCFYGVDTPERSELLAARNDPEAMARIIGVDSLEFLSLDGLYRAVQGMGRDAVRPQYCDACFSGDYPTSLEDFGLGGSADQLSLMFEDR
jgi:amidophosphoribosyltransferase